MLQIINVLEKILLSVLFSVNEFNMGVVFDLYETVPQLRALIAEHFSTNISLLAFWRNSAAAPLDLILE